MNTDRLSGLIAEIYDLVLDPAVRHTLPLTLAKAFDSESCYMQTRDLRTKEVFTLGATANVTLKIARQYEEYYWRLDPWDPTLVSMSALGRPVIGADTLTDRDVAESEFYRDFSRHCFMFDCLGVVFPVDGPIIGASGIQRPENAPRFTNDDKRAYGLVVPHLTRALQLSRRLATAVNGQAIAFDVLDRLGLMVMIVAADRRLVFANAAAEQLFRRGRTLTLRHGMVFCADLELDARFHGAVASAARLGLGQPRSAGDVLALRDPDGGPDLSMLITHLPRQAVTIGPTEPLAAVFITDPNDRRQHPEAIVASLYRLTPAEARLVVALLRGETLQSFVERHAVAETTVRWHLKQVFEKTGHRRQSDLIRAMLANPILRIVSEASPKDSWGSAAE